MSLLDKYRVKVTNNNGSWWFTLQECVEAIDPFERIERSVVSRDWFTLWYKERPVSWRLTSSPFGDGWFVLPRFWFKELQERVLIAVRSAVAIIVERENLKGSTHRLEIELNELATEAFRQALAEYEEAMNDR